MEGAYLALLRGVHLSNSREVLACRLSVADMDVVRFNRQKRLSEMDRLWAEVRNAAPDVAIAYQNLAKALALLGYARKVEAAAQVSAEPSTS